MQFLSTRGAESVSLDDALRRGIAADGGLYLPEKLPAFSNADFDGADTTSDVASRFLAPFFATSSLAAELTAIIDETFGFPIPLTELPVASGSAALLELFHGPTAAFKDVGAGFLAACLTRLDGDTEDPLTILVATSGDTGGAVAAAFDGRPGIRVVVLFPEGRVSARQAHQLCCWGDNVLSLQVRGSFDDCQAMVKAAMADAGLRRRFRFSSANSINIGRLLPQAVYYAQASLAHQRTSGNMPGFIVPTGNLGNAFACLLARACGLPIGPVVLATNANRTIADYLTSNDWQPRTSLQTLASAMDVGDPSNMERLRYQFGEADALQDLVGVNVVDDATIEQTIRSDHAEFGFPTCPHTATATATWRGLDDISRRQTDWILVATAHPAKFETIVEPLVGETIPVPSGLAALLERQVNVKTIDPGLEAIAACL